MALCRIEKFSVFQGKRKNFSMKDILKYIEIIAKEMLHVFMGKIF